MSSSALTAADVELDIEERALHLAVEETFEEIGRQWMPWAANGRAIRVGKLILIVDLDTLYRRIASGQGCSMRNGKHHGDISLCAAALHLWRGRACAHCIDYTFFHRKPAGKDESTTQPESRRRANPERRAEA
ncbi:hypothetical protein JB92DRAFT_3127398 [Gautieria morchelliformis]|nr:hypothetical protein JB92DRAFT_3127398 [Gautieria morchelliformis]